MRKNNSTTVLLNNDPEQDYLPPLWLCLLLDLLVVAIIAIIIKWMT